MFKILIIDDKTKDSLILKSIKIILKNRSYIYDNWRPSVILNNESPNLVFFDLRRSVNGDNVVNIIQGFDVYCRLRITIVYPFRLNILPFKNLYSSITKNFRRKNTRRMKEAYSRR